MTKEEIIRKEEEVVRFCSSNVEIKMGEQVNKEDLYKSYTDWSIRNELWILSSGNFSSIISDKYNKLTPKNYQNSKTGKRAWKNITLK